MKVDQLKAACEMEFFDDRIMAGNISEIQEFEMQFYSVENKVAIPIEEIATFYDKENDIDILDCDGKEIGRICFNRKVDAITQFTDYQLIAFVHDVSMEEFRVGKSSFDKDYLILPFDMFNEYMSKYYETAMLWGNFSHKSTDKNPYKMSIEQIVAREGISLPTEHHIETIMRANQQPFGFERFLKSYHMLELLFDLDLVNDIKEMGSDIKAIGKIMQEYSKKDEVYRLRKVVTNRCVNIEGIISALNEVKNHINLAKEIFFEFGKDSNPIKTTERQTATEIFDKIITGDTPFDYDNIKGCMNSMNTPEKHKAFILAIATYWIYRIRCSIAHHKIGEYMMGYDDERFIVEFAEPLLKEIILESFKENEEPALDPIPITTSA